MSAEIIIPPLGESVQEATIASISKKVGENIEVDELLIELETDKVTLEVNAPVSGVISELTISIGDTVRVGQVVGRINEDGVVDRQAAGQKNVPVSEGLKQVSDKILSPAVRKIVEESSIDTSKVVGTGKDGRITKGDLLDDSVKVSVAAVSVPQVNSVQQPVSTGSDEEVVKMTKLRQTIAKRLKDSQNTAAILTTFNEVDMSTVMKLRNDYKDVFLKKHGIKLGFMSFFVKACVIALQEIPAVNAEIRGDSIVYKRSCHIGVAVGTEQGLVVPVVRNTQNMNLAQIEKAIYDYGVKARDGKLSMSDLSGGTFTISNGGVYGSLLSTPIINPPQSGILGMHKIQDRPVVIDGKIEIRPMMYLALSYDHRIIDGKEAVTFLIRVKELLEDPARLVLDI